MSIYACLFIAAPPSYSDLAISESHRQDYLQGCDRSDAEGEDRGSLLTYITEFRYLPPPLYSEVLLSHTHTHTHRRLTGKVPKQHKQT